MQRYSAGRLGRVLHLEWMMGAWMGLLCAPLSSQGAEQTKTQSVSVEASKSERGGTIRFRAPAATDVEVAVVNAKGATVRRLAAGVLGGKNPPPPPLVAGLAQSLAWDGNDDTGKPATGEPFSARVRMGTRVSFGKMLGTSPFSGTLGGDSIVVAPNGGLYVKLASVVPQLHHAMPWQLRWFDAQGKYQRTLLPYPPSTPPDKTSGFRLVETGSGQLTPGHFSGLDPVLFRFGDNVYNRLVDGQVVFLDNETAALTFFKIDGSNGVKTVPLSAKNRKFQWAKWLAPQMAFSRDGKTVYFSNLALTPYDGKKPADIDPQFPQGRIYRMDLTKADPAPETFFDLSLPDFEKQPYWMPSAWDKKSAAAGIAVGPQGNLFVCDLVNQEVVEVSPEGKKLSTTKAPWPDKVEFAASGTMYVVSTAVSRGFKPPSELLKIEGRGSNAKIVARRTFKGEVGTTFAIDESTGKVVLWIGGGKELYRVQDQGTELAAAETSLINPSADDISFLCYGAVDAEADLVYVTSGMGPVWRYDGETGKGGLLPIKACDVAIGPAGMIYAWGDTGSYQGPIARYTRDARPAPLPGTMSHTFGKVYGRYGRGNNAPGMTVDWQGRVYVNCGFNDCHVRVYDAQGKLIEFERKARFDDNGKQPGGPAFLSYVLDQGGSLRADPAGNLYVLELGPPKGTQPPQGFAKDPAFLACTGTIYKFSPKGGEFKKTKEGWDAEGALTSYSIPCGPISGSWNSTGSACHCTRPRFDVDAYGRLYVPNGLTYTMTIRDNADNEILSFGGYGNWDAQGPQSREPKPEIPLGWPIFAGASEKHVYIGDGLNHRILRADKTWSHVAEVPFR